MCDPRPEQGGMWASMNPALAPGFQQQSLVLSISRALQTWAAWPDLAAPRQHNAAWFVKSPPPRGSYKQGLGHHPRQELSHLQSPRGNRVQCKHSQDPSL